MTIAIAATAQRPTSRLHNIPSDEATAAMYNAHRRRGAPSSSAQTAISSGSQRKYGNTGTSPAPTAQSASSTAAKNPPLVAVTAAAIGTSIANAAASSTA